MRALILVALILHLTLSLTADEAPVEELKFGDILVFPRGGLYNHFGLYVKGSDKEYPGDYIERNLLNIVKKNKVERSADIAFANLEKKTYSVNNSLDKAFDGSKRTPKLINERIALAWKDPGKYSMKSNNCEHLATFLRYGVGNSEQLGTLLGKCVVEKTCDHWIQVYKHILTSNTESLEEAEDAAVAGG
ncbi:phospholipase A and acyltransferase 3-like [Cololabis saira]|uniref:phospholipase A and acyltransferase 3-like n=1 Tax=Cololabis saira TaxID=129043 RepID=UPI002AD28699|nr:phospholipase A and acyltransferase 3-like [Cololabis saira]